MTRQLSAGNESQRRSPPLSFSMDASVGDCLLASITILSADLELQNERIAHASSS